MNHRLIAATAAAFAAAALSASSFAAPLFGDGGKGGPSQTHKAYVTNLNSNSVSVVDIDTSVLITTIPVGDQPMRAVKSPDNQFVYVSNLGSQTVSVISTSSDSVVGTVDVSFPEPADLVVTPDGATLYVVEKNSFVDVGGGKVSTGDGLSSGNSVVSVIDTATLTETTVIPVTSKGFDPRSEGLAITPDGAFVFVLNTFDDSINKISTATNTVVDFEFTDVNLPRRAKVTDDGSLIVILGDGNSPQYMLVSNLSDQGSDNGTFYNDLVQFDNFAYATRNNGSLEIIDALNHNILLSDTVPQITTPNGIDVSPDHQILWVADDEVDELAPIGFSKGFFPVGKSVALDGSGPHNSVVIVAINTNIGQTLLPHAVRVDLHNGNNDHLYFHGNYNDAGAPVNLHAPVTIQFGGFSRTVTLTERQFGKFFSFLDGTMHLVVTPKVHGSSRGIIQCTLRGTDLNGLVNENGTLAIHFHASGIPDAPATVVMDSGNYRIGRVPGTLINPQLSLKNIRIKTGQVAPDKLQLRAGFTSGGTAPNTLGSVSVSLGETFGRTIPGSQFKKLGERFRFVESTPTSYLWITIDFKREVILIGSVGNALGDLSGIQNFTMNWGTGLGSFTIPIVLAQVEREMFF